MYDLQAIIRERLEFTGETAEPPCPICGTIFRYAIDPQDRGRYWVCQCSVAVARDVPGPLVI